MLEPRVSSRLLKRAATYLQARAEYAQARPLHERALAINEKVLGPDHRDTASSLSNLAYLFTAQGDLGAPGISFRPAVLRSASGC